MGRSVAAAPALALAGLAASVPPPAAGAVEAPGIMAGAERYCDGYEKTFDGMWTSGAGAPVPFRVGVGPSDAEARACYAQLNVDEARRIAPYELRRYQASPGPGGVWTLRYRRFEVEIDPARGTAAHRRGEADAETGVLLPAPPPVAPAPPPLSPDRAEPWYGEWKGRFPGVPVPVTLRLSESGPGRVGGELSALFVGSRSFTGRFHGGMLVFPWKNRYVGFSLEPGGEALVHVSYRGEVFRFRRLS